MRRHPSSLRAAILAVALVLAAAPWSAATTHVKLDVPYVPTSEEVVAEMLRLANVTKQDLLYDLGSGDGRIVIAAAKQFGTRGVGIDIDPERVREANENAQRAGVAHLVTFIEGDIFEADISPATVVTMYLLPEVNLRLRPKLLSQLRPGARIVSHNYDLGDWKPDRRVRVGTHLVFYWRVPSRAADRR
jgi:23S rRNA G2445 N2-methylase RlmL